ncbi:hypothetical protein ACGFJ7_16930 [Actinoplanes sp. NPDC048988]|uniref:hypothetical protein n=1 Tax=Actinoplanes sp. NPDC048988 TaxID=3363901 RepID=UPI003712C9DE
MATRLVQITMKARDDAALGWTLSSGGPGVTNLEPVSLTDPEGNEFCLPTPA